MQSCQSVDCSQDKIRILKYNKDSQVTDNSKCQNYFLVFAAFNQTGTKIV